MPINIENAIAWMKARQGRVSYSMEERDGDDSYDCSSSVYYALRSAGAVSAGWAVNTEYEHQWLINNGYTLISENTPWDAQRGDVFIWGRKGASAGAGGHTGIFIDEDNIIHCNYRYDGITVNDHDDIWVYAGKPYYYIYRLTNQNAAPKVIEKGWKTDAKGDWYQRANGTWPKDGFEYIEENKSWFYFNSEGYCVKSDWILHTDGEWYYFDANGYMVTSWRRIDGKWYYFNRDGSMKKGWVKYYDDWYFLDEKNGDMLSDRFVPYKNGYYMLLPDGRMADKEAFKVEPDGLITTK